MVEVVLDASAAAKMFRPEPESAALRDWVAAAVAQGTVFVVPAIFPFEMGNIAARSVIEGVLGSSEAAWTACDAVLRLVDVAPPEGKAELVLAVQSKLSTYDAAYLRLALEGRALVTYDERLAKAARGGGRPGTVFAPA